MTAKTKRWIGLAGAIALFGLAGYVYSHRSRPIRYTTVAVDRGDVIEAVGATGALQAVTSVQVGSQVSGTIQSLSADFNTTVKKGQVIARLDPSTFQARLGQARANLASARANVDRAQAELADNEQKYKRAQELAGEALLAKSDLDSAQAAYQGSQAGVKAAQAAVTQAQASVNQAQLDLDHTVIATPIDGVVVNRSVDVGQTVAASLQAPTLFIIANDLAHMQVNATVDEADVGRVKEGLEVTFHVDAYPERTFVGRVQQVRLQPQTVQNVVSYNTLIAVDNPEGKLLPGMTATVSIIARKATNTLRVPASALRFRPEGFEPRRRSASPSPTASNAAGAASSARTGRFRGAGGGGEARVDGGQRGLVFQIGPGGKLEPVRIETGVTDGQWVEVKSGLAEGQSVIIGVEAGGASAGSVTPRASPSATNPFVPAPPNRRTR